ncbi:choline transport protein, partial [Lecanoromycetidae sp. Uapishka_2]
MSAEEKILSEHIQEDAVLENLGYQQELRRTFGLLGMIGFAFSIVTSWTALGGVLIVGVESGGPPVMIYSWIGVSIFGLAVAYSMAEMCSAYPLAGGQYSWVAVLAPPKIARGMSWVTGWFMIVGILAMGATNNFIGANFILGQANLSFPSYTIERWHTVLLAYLIALISTGVNIYGPHLLDRISRFILLWNMLSFVIVIITILATNDHKQPASFVFSDFQNFTGFSTGFAAILGLLQSSFGMCCYDAPAHMTEEMKNASREAPKAIVMSVYIGAVTGFIFLISICFCIGDITSTAESTTGVPLIQIFYDSTNSVVGACFLSSLIVVIVLVCANALLAEGSRSLFAFARDHGLPFSKLFATVESKRQVPVYSILLACAVQVALNSIYFGTLTGFNTVISIATEGFYLSYAMPLLARTISWFMGDAKTLPGPYSLGKWGIWMNLAGLLFLIFTSITFNFPTLNPVDSGDMNYTSAAIGIIALISLVTWITTGRKSFTGPQIAGEVPVLEARAEMVNEGLANKGDL